MASKNQERSQTELNLTTIAYNIKLTHKHKMKQIKQKKQEKHTTNKKLLGNSNIKKFH